MDINAAGSSAAGVSDEKIAALPDYRTSLLYSESERAALELADAMSAAHVDVPDALFDRLREHFSEVQLVELAATAALENFRARFNRAFLVEPNSLYCVVPRPADAAG
jgi:alkylhydroperoxidase family enzyme